MRRNDKKERGEIRREAKREESRVEKSTKMKRRKLNDFTLMNSNLCGISYRSMIETSCASYATFLSASESHGKNASTLAV